MSNKEKVEKKVEKKKVKKTVEVGDGMKQKKKASKKSEEDMWGIVDEQLMGDVLRFSELESKGLSKKEIKTFSKNLNTQLKKKVQEDKALQELEWAMYVDGGRSRNGRNTAPQLGFENKKIPNLIFTVTGAVMNEINMFGDDGDNVLAIEEEMDVVSEVVRMNGTFIKIRTTKKVKDREELEAKYATSFVKLSKNKTFQKFYRDAGDRIKVENFLTFWVKKAKNTYGL